MPMISRVACLLGVGGAPRRALWLAGLALAGAAAWLAEPELVVLDTLTGLILVGLGLTAWSLRPRSLTGGLMAATGFAWFLGSFMAWAVYLHRGPFAHMLLSYPGRGVTPPSRVERSAVIGAYVYAGVSPIARNDYASIAFALGLMALAARRYVAAGGPERRARLAALVGATAFGLVLIAGTAMRLAGAGADREVLVAYEAVVCLIAAGLFADLLWGRWTHGTVTGVVVDLGEPAGTATLRDRLARTLGDPTLIVGYWLREQGIHVDEAGRPVDLPSAERPRALTPILDDGERVAVLVHDESLLDDPALMSAVAAATRLAVSNARLQADVRERVAEVEASRRRIVAAADEQRHRLERDLRAGTTRRLGRVAELAARIDPELERQVVAAQAQLGALARGIHPAELTELGLAEALRELCGRAGTTIEWNNADRRLDAATEAAAYFVCSEALANVAKHSSASETTVRVSTDNGLLTVEVTDDGVGGADAAAGTGLQGLSDRVETLGGRLTVASPPEGGTRVVAELPCV
jgi:signal transduction histidine kinase